MSKKELQEEMRQNIASYEAQISRYQIALRAVLEKIEKERAGWDDIIQSIKRALEN